MSIDILKELPEDFISLFLAIRQQMMLRNVADKCTTTHTKEPWYAVAVDNSYEIFSESEEYNVAWSIDSEANAERIVACVNACIGVPNEDLLKVVAFGKEHVERMRKLEGKESSVDTFEYNMKKLGEGSGY